MALFRWPCSWPRRHETAVAGLRPRGLRLRTALFLGVGIARPRSGSSPTRPTRCATSSSTRSTPASRSAARRRRRTIWSSCRSTTSPSTSSNLRWPFPRSLHGKVIDHIAADSPKAIGYDVQFTEPSERFDDDIALAEAIVEGAKGRSCSPPPRSNERGRSAILGGEEVLREIGARPGQCAPAARPGGGDRRVAYAVDKLKTLAVVATEVASGRPVRPAAVRRPHGVDRLRRAAGDDQVRLVLACRAGQDAARLVPGQGRGRRPVRAVAAGRPPHVDDGQRADGRRRDPGERDRHRAPRLPARAGAGRARRAPDRPARARGAAGEPSPVAAAGDRAGARRRRGLRGRRPARVQPRHDPLVRVSARRAAAGRVRSAGGALRDGRVRARARPRHVRALRARGRRGRRPRAPATGCGSEACSATARSCSATCAASRSSPRSCRRTR